MSSPTDYKEVAEFVFKYVFPAISAIVVAGVSIVYVLRKVIPDLQNAVKDLKKGQNEMKEAISDKAAISYVNNLLYNPNGVPRFMEYGHCDELREHCALQNKTILGQVCIKLDALKESLKEMDIKREKARSELSEYKTQLAVIQTKVEDIKKGRDQAFKNLTDELVDAIKDSLKKGK